MTTPCDVLTNTCSISYDDKYINVPPITPCQIPYHNYGILFGMRPTPPQFYPTQEPVNSEMNTNARRQYLRTAVSNSVKFNQNALGKLSHPNRYTIYSSQRQTVTSTHTNYIPPIDSSLYINILKSNAVGQTSYKVNLPNSAPTSTKNYYPSGIRSTIRRVRSGGCVAPKKKGAIENYSLHP